MNILVCVHFFTYFLILVSYGVQFYGDQSYAADATICALTSLHPRNTCYCVNGHIPFNDTDFEKSHYCSVFELHHATCELLFEDRYKNIVESTVVIGIIVVITVFTYFLVSFVAICFPGYLPQDCDDFSPLTDEKFSNQSYNDVPSNGDAIVVKEIEFGVDEVEIMKDFDPILVLPDVVTVDVIYTLSDNSDNNTSQLSLNTDSMPSLV